MANRKKKNAILPTIHSAPSGSPGIGDSHPPKNRIDISAHIRKMAMYSPAMKRRNGVDEYSTWYPATSSDSASGRSNGGRFVSASAETKKSTNHRKMGQPVPAEETVRAILGHDDLTQVERAGGNEDADNDEADRHLVGDHLRRRAQRPQKGVF